MRSPMHGKWTTVLLTTALAGSIAATTGIAASSATPDRHPMIQPEVAAPDAAKTLEVVGDLGAVLNSVGELATASQPTGGAAVDPAALKSKLAQLDAASGKLKAALPAATAPGLPTLPSGPAVPSAPGVGSAPAVPSAPGAPSVPSAVTQPSAPAAPSAPSLPSAPSVPSAPALPADPAVPGAVSGVPVHIPVPVVNGGPLQRVTPPVAVGSVEDQLAAIKQHATDLVTAASAKKPDAAAVQAALTPLSADTLGLSTATVTRLTGV